MKSESRAFLLGTAMSAVILFGAGTAAQAKDEVMGDFSGVTLKAKFIGGNQYEPLYSRITDWEKATGGKVEIISKKSHFEIDKEIKSDIAAGSTDWCVGYNHVSFAPQYTSLYTDLKPYIPQDTLDKFSPALIDAATINGELQMLPRAQFDVSALYYRKSLYADPAKQKAFKEKYGYDLTPPETFDQFKDQAIFFADPPNFYGTQYAGKEEAVVGRFYELLVANGGQMFDEDWKPTFNSEAGQQALQWFVDLYKAKAVPPGVLSYVWDDLGSGFASGSVALDLDWPGWAGYFNDPKQSKIAGDVGVVVQPKGSSGKRTGWSGMHGFSMTKDCDQKEAAASLIWFLTNHDSQLFEASKGPLPTRTQVWDDLIAQVKESGDGYRAEVLSAFQEASKHAFAVPKFPEWVESTNLIYPELQAAIVGDKTAKQALDEAAQRVGDMMADYGY
ncbi:sugar ABC transporter substrate-binding protein (plasmid) [Thalassospira marina]|uniref:Sugar ABC transporter substrate-binding protein n=2 Tax=Thalassospira marina TaxID=2048283 RepID=A0ABN5FMB7_9PROT|nr:sugar ABC transporter substrate-binding protein [Thalassospira marina]